MSNSKQLSRSVAGLAVLVTGAASGMGRATVAGTEPTVKQQAAE
jgi:NADP-dependent 3-hydroxy acid dehydrogenase YdfG